jgi:hypothetical protein
VTGSLGPESSTMQRDGRQGTGGLIGDHEPSIRGHARHLCISQVAIGQSEQIVDFLTACLVWPQPALTL